MHMATRCSTVWPPFFPSSFLPSFLSSLLPYFLPYFLPYLHEVVYRLATFHLDRINLAPVEIAPSERMPVLKVLHSTIEHAVPDWVEQARRLGGE